MAKPFTTLDDVAKAAGMSRAQVSRALRGDPGVRPETRERIDQIASELEYRPNLAARSLVSARSSIVGLVIGDPNNAFHIQLAQSVDKRLLAAGFEPVTSLRPVEGNSAAFEIERLLTLRAAGVILLGTPHHPKVIGEIADKLPCVFIGSKRVAHKKSSQSRSMTRQECVLRWIICSHWGTEELLTWQGDASLPPKTGQGSTVKS